MKILLLTMYYAPDVAANAVIVGELSEELAGLGHKVTVVTSFPHYASGTLEHAYGGGLLQREDYRGVTVMRAHVYTSPHKRRLWVRLLNYVSFNLLSTLAGLFAGPQDIVLAPSPPLTIGLSAYIISRLKRIPYVYNVQDVYPDVVVKLGILKNPLAINLSRWLERFVYAHARCVTVLSGGFRANLLAKGVPEAKLAVIPNFVDVDFVRPRPRDNDFRRRLGLDGRFVVLYAGNLGHSQNLEHVLECAALLREHGDILFLIVGNGSRKPQIEARAREMGLANVLFLPFQPREEVPDLYATADVSLITLRKGIAQDSVPSKSYTIMASGRPIVAAVDPGSDAWQLVERAECGLCVTPESPEALAGAIHTLYRDAQLRERLGHNGRAHVVAHYSRQAIGRRYHELLTRLLEGKHGGRKDGGNQGAHAG